MITPSTFTKILKGIRTDHQISLNEIALATGIDSDSIITIERGQKPFPFEKTRQWALVLGTDPDVLLAMLVTAEFDNIYTRAGMTPVYDIVPRPQTKQPDRCSHGVHGSDCYTCFGTQVSGAV